MSDLNPHEFNRTVDDAFLFRTGCQPDALFEDCEDWDWP